MSSMSTELEEGRIENQSLLDKGSIVVETVTCELSGCLLPPARRPWDEASESELGETWGKNHQRRQPDDSDVVDVDDLDGHAGGDCRAYGSGGARWLLSWHDEWKHGVAYHQATDGGEALEESERQDRGLREGVEGNKPIKTTTHSNADPFLATADKEGDTFLWSPTAKDAGSRLLRSDSQIAKEFGSPRNSGRGGLDGSGDPMSARSTGSVDGYRKQRLLQGGPTLGQLTRYFAVDVMGPILPNVIAVFISCCAAVFTKFYWKLNLNVSYIPMTPTQVVLGFLVGFYLNKAFDRNKNAFNAIQTMSIRSQTMCYHMISFGFSNYRLRYAELLKPEYRERAIIIGSQAVALCKYYFVSCCIDLNTASLAKEFGDGRKGRTASAISEAYEKWDEFLSKHVKLSRLCKTIVHKNRTRLQSGLHFGAMCRSWIMDTWEQFRPLRENFEDTHRGEKAFKEASAEYAEITREHHTEIKDFEACYVAAHDIAHGRKSPVHFWLLGMLVFTMCVFMPWVVVGSYGYFVFIPSLLLAYIFFGARQIGADFWEPFGLDGGGLVDINLKVHAEEVCEKMNSLLRLSEDIYALHKTWDGSRRIVVSPFRSLVGKDGGSSNNRKFVSTGGGNRSP